MVIYKSMYYGQILDTLPTLRDGYQSINIHWSLIGIHDLYTHDKDSHSRMDVLNLAHIEMFCTVDGPKKAFRM